MIDALYQKLIEIDIVKESTLSSKVFTGLIFVGLFTKFYIGNVIKTSDGSNGPATGTIWGYTMIVLSLISIVFLNSVTGNVEDYNTMSGIFKLFPIPILLLIIVLLWEIMLNYRYQRTLNKRDAPDMYYMFSRYSTILLTFQIISTLFQYAMHMIIKNNEIGVTSIKLNSFEVSTFLDRLNNANFLLIFLNFVVITIKQVILEKYNVDGDTYYEEGQ
jgi:hypothetical protein